MFGSIMWTGPDGVARFTPRRADVSVHDLIACSCGARVDECCRSKSGNKVLPHVGRLAPRLCSCGRVPRRDHRFCDRCGALVWKRSKWRRRKVVA